MPVPPSGPIASGFLLEHFSWGAVFLVNVPIIIVALVAGSVPRPTLQRPRARPARPGRRAAVDRRALGASSTRSSRPRTTAGPAPTTLAWFAAALVLLGVFIAWELRSSAPDAQPATASSDRRFSVASGGITLVFFAMFGTFFLITQYFQLVLGLRRPRGRGEAAADGRS